MTEKQKGNIPPVQTLTVLGCWPKPSLENALVFVSFSHILNLSISRSISFRASTRACSYDALTCIKLKKSIVKKKNII